MKRFFSYVSIGLVILAIVLFSVLTFGVSADSGNIAENVVYISDSATEVGDILRSALDE